MSDKQSDNATSDMAMQHITLYSISGKSRPVVSLNQCATRRLRLSKEGSRVASCSSDFAITDGKNHSRVRRGTIYPKGKNSVPLQLLHPLVLYSSPANSETDERKLLILPMYALSHTYRRLLIGATFRRRRQILLDWIGL